MTLAVRKTEGSLPGPQPGREGVRSDWVPETLFGTWFLSTEMWRRHVLPPAIEELAQLLGPVGRISRILDVGCGRGHALPLLAQRFSPELLIGVEVDPDLIGGAVKAAKACDCAVKIQTGEATKLDLPDRSVDLVFCHQTMHHLRYQEAAAREFFRVLKPGGTLLFAESCRAFIYSLWIRLLFRHPMEVQKSADEYLALLATAGFTFEGRHISRPRPPWSRPDIGLLDLIGRGYKKPFPDPLVFVAARRPDETAPMSDPARAE